MAEPINALRAECALDVRAELGEGPVWISDEEALYFVDINGHRIHRFVPQSGALTTWIAPGKVACLLPLDDGSFFCGMPGSLCRFYPSDGTFQHEIEIEADLPGNRLNDGCVDLHGRGWFGTMDDSEENPSGSIYSIHHGEEGFVIRRHDTGYVVSNGPAVSPDGRTLYVCDTPNGAIYCFDVTAAGMLENKRLFLYLPEEKGYPDGVVTDCEGNVWCSTWGGGHVRCFTPDGVERFSVQIPAMNVTKVAFGGLDRKIGYVTTARKGLSEAVLAQQPQAGSLFRFASDKAGLPQHRIRLSV